MSSDLLAEFDTFYKPSTASSKAEPALNDLSSLGQLPQLTAQPSGSARPQAAETDDIWSFFSQASGEKQDNQWGSSIPQSSGAFNSQRSQQKSFAAHPGLVRASTTELLSNSVADLAEAINVAPSQAKVPFTEPPAQTQRPISEVLFDADEVSNEPDNDEEEFGEFEVGMPDISSHTEQAVSVAIEAVCLESKIPNQHHYLAPSSLKPTNLPPYPQAPKSPSFLDRKPTPSLGLSTSNDNYFQSSAAQNSATPVTAWPDFVSPSTKHDTEEWGQYEDYPLDSTENQVPASQSKNIQISKPASKENQANDNDSWDWSAAVTPPRKISFEDETSLSDLPPPCNIPPPSVLLSIFPQLFELPQATLFKAVAGQTYSLKHRVLSDSSTIRFLEGFLLIAIVAARIVTGRKLRWKRDMHLSQAMSMGPSATSGKGGMKLAGIDKAEMSRENREAFEVVRVWKEHLGRLRSAVAVANSSMHEGSVHLSIPEIDENMSAKAEAGAMTAPKPCIVCGLKREERINKVDVQVEDSFGEWWTEHWGHVACKNFWMEHESKLRNR